MEHQPPATLHEWSTITLN